MTFRAVLFFLCLILSFITVAYAAEIDPAAEYRSCMDLARSNPAKGFDAAVGWQGLAGPTVGGRRPSIGPASIPACSVGIFHRRWGVVKSADGPMRNILEYCDEPIVSSDVIGNSHSSILDAQSTRVMDGNFAKLLAWYDNEWGYASRVVDLALLMGR